MMFKNGIAISCAVILVFCGGIAMPADLNNDEVLGKYIDAYNAHDIDGMLEYMAAEVRWMNIAGAELSVATTGKAEFRNVMSGYFEHFPTAQSSITESQSVGDFITTVEKASWEWEDSLRSQCATAIYSFENNLIVNVWYHVAQPCGE